MVQITSVLSCFPLYIVAGLITDRSPSAPRGSPEFEARIDMRPRGREDSPAYVPTALDTESCDKAQ